MKMYFLILTTAFAVLTYSSTNAQPEGVLLTTYFQNLANNEYNPLVPPTGNGGYGSPVQVFSEMYILDIHKIDDFNMDYRASFYFRQAWNDSRLSYEDMDISNIILNDASHLWTPDLFFVQEKEGIKHNIIGPNAFIRISPEGEVRYSVRLSLTFSCPMDFRKYPHDIQTCPFSIESYGRSRDMLHLEWDTRTKNPVQKADQINVLPFELMEVSHTAKNVDFSTGKYRCLEVTLTFKRNIGFFLTRLYIPLIFLVVISWLSFWIKPKMVTLRLSLLLVILYLINSISSAVNSYIPPAPYTKASDVFIAVSESLVFGAFLEFILVTILIHKEGKPKKIRCSTDAEAPMIIDAKETAASVESEKSETIVRMIAARLTDQIKLSKRVNAMATILFPVLYIVFNFLYFLIY